VILKNTAGSKIGPNNIGLQVFALKLFWIASTERPHGGFPKWQRQFKRLTATEAKEGRLACRPSSVLPVILIKKTEQIF